MNNRLLKYIKFHKCTLFFIYILNIKPLQKKNKKKLQKTHFFSLASGFNRLNCVTAGNNYIT